MSNYAKLKNAQLAELLELRDLPPGGTKLEMAARLRKQDAEDEAAYKATAAAVKAASSGAPSNAHTQGTSGGGKDRGGGVRKRSEEMRRERLEKGKGKGRAKGKEPYWSMLDAQAAAEEAFWAEEAFCDEDAIVRKLLREGVDEHEHEHEAATADDHGIVVTPTTPVRGHRMRWQNTTKPAPLTLFTTDDDDANSEASTIRPSPARSDKTITPADFSKKRAVAARHDADDASLVFVLALIFAVVYICLLQPGTATYIFALLADPVKAVMNGGSGPSAAA